MQKNMRSGFIKKTNYKKQKARNGICYDQYDYSLKERLFYTARGGALAICYTFTFYRDLSILILTIPFIIHYPIFCKVKLKETRLRTLNMEFKDAIEGISSGLSAGYSVENAFRETSREMKLLHGAGSDIDKELSLITDQLDLNKNIEEILMEFALRTKQEDIINFSESFVIAKRSGGDLVQMVRRAATMISEKIRVREEIQILITGKKLEQKIMNGIPLGIVLYLNIFSPQFLNMLYQTLGGRVIMTCCLLSYLAAVRWSEQIMRIEM